MGILTTGFHTAEPGMNRGGRWESKVLYHPCSPVTLVTFPSFSEHIECQRG
jgi:hypothetical protein